MTPIEPGSTLGVFGGGQLGRMFAQAAARMGYRVHAYCPTPDSPTAHVADAITLAPYDDLESVADFASKVSVATFEFENILSATADRASEICPVRPSGHALHTSQNRLREKTFLASHGIPVAPFRPVTSLSELQEALEDVGAPAILKSASWGYDGKGQVRIEELHQAEDAWKSVATDEAVLESFVAFDHELSVITARGLDGETVHHGPFRNAHHRHILDVTVCPAGFSSAVNAEAVSLAQGVVEALDYVGVLCVEMFYTKGQALIVNEIAPRPHNSGHLTIDAHTCCQFEQQVRAICGLPLGGGTQLASAAMANLLGDLWQAGPPDWSALREFPEARLHLYGKSDARAGRKMGHVTVLASSPDEAEDRVIRLRKRLFPDAALGYLNDR
ncbi:MAG: 5-(carboxyamino)imidazole ribonucleotide synthase [Phycisphaerae bacterium]